MKPEESNGLEKQFFYQQDSIVLFLLLSFFTITLLIPGQLSLKKKKII